MNQQQGNRPEVAFPQVTVHFPDGASDRQLAYLRKLADKFMGMESIAGFGNGMPVVSLTWKFSNDGVAKSFKEQADMFEDHVTGSMPS